MITPSSNRHAWSLLLLIFCLSLPVKLIAAHNMVWDMDIVPVVARGQAWLDGGAFPAVGTLSSVAAYNMPFLVWLHVPALLFTDDARLAMLITLLIFNFIGTLYCYLAGAAIFQPRTGLIAAALFTFSETSVSSTYTAWAQLLLPVFFMAVFYHLWQWQALAKGRHLVLAGIIATAGFMTHFAAIMLFPAMLFFALITRARWQWRSLLLGIIACGWMLAPYFVFEAGRDFVDLRAFLTRRSPISAETLALYEQTIGQGASIPNTDNASGSTPNLAENQPAPVPENTAQTPSRPERFLAFMLSLPRQYWDALRMFNVSETTALNHALPNIILLTTGLSYAITGLFVVVCGVAVVRFLQEIIQSRKIMPVIVRTSYRNARSRHVSHPHVSRTGQLLPLDSAHNPRMTQTAARKIVLILAFMLVFITGLIMTRAAPAEQGSYYTGLFSLQLLIVAYGIAWGIQLGIRPDEESGQKYVSFGALCILLLLILYLWGLGADRILRISQHPDRVYSRYNVWLYRHIEAAADYIAADWQTATNPVIRYDILPEMANMWWVVPWNTVDPLYRIGAPYDYLLQVQHHITNANTRADGSAENPDYIVVYLPGLARYTLEDYEITQFGAIYVLKPRRV